MREAGLDEERGWTGRQPQLNFGWSNRKLGSIRAPPWRPLHPTLSSLWSWLHQGKEHDLVQDSSLQLEVVLREVLSCRHLISILRTPQCWGIWMVYHNTRSSKSWMLPRFKRSLMTSCSFCHLLWPVKTEHRIQIHSYSFCTYFICNSRWSLLKMESLFSPYLSHNSHPYGHQFIYAIPLCFLCWSHPGNPRRKAGERSSARAATFGSAGFELHGCPWRFWVKQREGIFFFFP